MFNKRSDLCSDLKGRAMIGFGCDKNQNINKISASNIDKVSASKFGTDFSNWFGLAKLRKGEVA